jgi:hypothetical protein
LKNTPVSSQRTLLLAEGRSSHSTVVVVEAGGHCSSYYSHCSSYRRRPRWMRMA